MKKHRFENAIRLPAIMVSVVCLFLALLFLWGLAPCWGQPEFIQGAPPGNCSICHGDGEALPQGHPDTHKMTLQDCKGCHGDASTRSREASSRLSKRLSLWHVHALDGQNCAVCHRDLPDRPAADICIACHPDYKNQDNRLNPTLPRVHDSHMGDLACNLCHKAHGPSFNFCSQCHYWKYIVP